MVTIRMGKDPAAIGLLYADERQRLFRRFRRRGLPEATASDLVQESFARLLRSRNDEIRDLRAYLYRAADSAERDLRRAEFRARRIIAPEAEPDESHADPTPAVEAQIIGSQEHDALRAAVATLPPRPREVLLLHRFEGLSYAEISQRLGISRNTVMVHMVKALGLLRKRMAPGDAGGE